MHWAQFLQRILDVELRLEILSCCPPKARGCGVSTPGSSELLDPDAGFEDC